MELKKEKLVKHTAICLLMFLLLLSAMFVGSGWIGGHFKSMETLRAYLESYGKLGPIVLTAIQALQVVLPVLPGFFGCIVGAAMFGAVGGFWINYIGISTRVSDSVLACKTFRSQPCSENGSDGKV